MNKVTGLLHRLRTSRSGVAMTELALTTPFIMGVGLWGMETANLALVHMRVSQLAMHISDNASRIGDTSSLQNRKIYEADINDLFIGSNIQGGEALDFYDHGRVIVSSLQVRDDDPTQQFIKWQRCKGTKTWPSSYGDEDDDVDGMGPAGEEITTVDGEAVIFVEVSYDYQPLISNFFGTPTTITTTAAFSVRDSRDLSQIYQRTPPVVAATCNLHSGF